MRFLEFNVLIYRDLANMYTETPHLTAAALLPPAAS